eukprot:scaffold418112_cov28-Prasinocladus_malaysianus.AAC.1
MIAVIWYDIIYYSYSDCRLPNRSQGTTKLFMDEILQESSVQVFHQHSMVVQQNEYASHIYVVLEGELFVYGDHDTGVTGIAQPGATVGIDTALCNLPEVRHIVY